MLLGETANGVRKQNRKRKKPGKSDFRLASTLFCKGALEYKLCFRICAKGGKGAGLSYPLKSCWVERKLSSISQTLPPRAKWLHSPETFFQEKESILGRYT